MSEDGEVLTPLYGEPLQGGMQWVIENHKPLIIRHLSQEAEIIPVTITNIPGTRTNKQSLVYVPLMLRDMVFGALSVQHTMPDAYNEEDIIVLQLIGNHITLALSNIHLYKSLYRAHKIGQKVTQIHETEQELQQVIDLVLEHIKADLLLLYLYEQNHQQPLLPVYISGDLLHPDATSTSEVELEEIALSCLQANIPTYAKVTQELCINGKPHQSRRFINFEEREQIKSTAVLPLKIRGEPVGVLFVNFRRKQHFDAAQKLLIESLTNNVAVAIRNSHKFISMMNRRVAELELVQKIDQAINHTLDLEEVLQAILHIAQTHIGAIDEASILLHNPLTDELETKAAIGDNAAFNRTQIIPVQSERGLTRRTFVSGAPLWIDDIQGNSLWREQYLEGKADIRSEFDVPLRDADRTIGVINFESRAVDAFSQIDRDFLTTLAGQAVLAITNAQAYQREQRLAQQQKTLVEIGQYISSTLDLDVTLQRILDQATKYISTDAAAIWLYEPRSRKIRVRATVGLHAQIQQKMELSVDDIKGIPAWVFSEKQPARLDNVRDNPFWQRIYVMTAENVLSELDIPLINPAGEVIGIINFESTREAAFTQADEDFLVALAGQAVLAVQNAQAYQREQRIADERKALMQVNQQIISQLKPELVFDVILEKALEITNCSAGNLMLYDPVHNDFWMAAERGVEVQQKGRRQRMNEGVVGLVARMHTPLNIGDITEPPWNDTYISFIPDIRSELAIPLLDGSTIRGVLNIESPSPNHFDEYDEHFLTVFADLAVVAIQNAEQYHDLEKGKARLRALQEIDQEIISQLQSPDLVMRTILDKVLKLTGAETADLDIYEEGKPQTTYFAHAHGDEVYIVNVNETDTEDSLIMRGIVKHVAESREPYLTGNAQQDPLYAGDPTILSEVAVPLIDAGELIGVLNLESTQVYAFDEEDCEVLEIFAVQAVIAIQNARAYVRNEEARQRFQSLYEVGQQLGSVIDASNLEQAYEVIAQAASSTSGHPQTQVIVRRYDTSTEAHVLAYAKRSDLNLTFHLNQNEGVNGQVFRDRQILVINDINQSSLQTCPSDHEARTLVVVPIQFSQDHYYGSLSLSHPNRAAFNEEDVRLFEGLAQQLAITIYRLESIQAQQEAEQRARDQEIMSSIGQTAFELAHRLGNELGLIRSYVSHIYAALPPEDVASEIDNPEVAENLQSVVEDVTNVLDLSQKLTQVVRGLQSEQDKPADISIKRFIEEVIRSNAVLGESIDIQIVASESPLVRAIPSHVLDILRNLMQNAIDAMETGGILSFQISSAERYTEVRVQDTGNGIPQERINRIFDLFYSTKGSSGFGLWSARQRARANGGDLLVESELGQGSTFILLLPKPI
jgi:GAF domain-containing protein